MGGTTTWIMLAVIIAIIGFVIVSAIVSRKANKKEKEQRKTEVRNSIKQYLLNEEKLKNVRIDFQRVYARKGAEYKYRDIFDVLVLIIEPKTNKVIEERVFEIEGIHTKIDKKKFSTKWQVNGTLDLEATKRKIAIAQKEIKLTSAEKKVLKKEERDKEKELRQKEKDELNAAKKQSKIDKKVAPVESTINHNQPKFVPTRKKAN